MGLNPRGAQPHMGPEVPSANPREFGVPKHLWRLWLHQIGPGKSLSSASLPPAGHSETISPLERRLSPQAGCAAGWGCTGCPQGIPEPGLHPGRWLGWPALTSALGRHPPWPHCSVPAWPGPSALCWPPSLGASQVLERSWERSPRPRCGSAQTLGDPRAGPCQGLISWLIHCCFKSALIRPATAGSQLESAFWAKSPGPGFGLPTMGITLPAAASTPGGAMAP